MKRFVITGSLGCQLTLLVSALAGVSVAQTPRDSGELPRVVHLREVEARNLPPALVPGAAQHAELLDYYIAANQELAGRLSECRTLYEDDPTQPFHRLTLISGSAGVGKTFLKGLVFSKNYPKPAVCKFDLRELYDTWRAEGQVIDKPDLVAGKMIISSLPALTDSQSSLLYDHLCQQTANFFVIDSLDEVHPDDYQSALEQIEHFTFDAGRPFVHVVVLGRGCAFRDFWKKHHLDHPPLEMDLFNLEPPQFRTLGDLTVSTWNYHLFQHRLAWPDDSNQPFSLADFSQWQQQRFAAEGRFAEVQLEPSNAIDGGVEATLAQWATRYPYLNEMLRNLAGNSMIREIAYQRIPRGEAHDESAVQRDYLHLCLERNAARERRPSAAQAEQLDVYLTLLETVATTALNENRLDAAGFFQCRPDELVQINIDGQTIGVPVQRLLDRSGLVFTDPRNVDSLAYRFEPIWTHRLLVQQEGLHPRGASGQTVGQNGLSTRGD